MLKNVKIEQSIHQQVKLISAETGINIGTLFELGAIKLIDSYKGGEFDNIKTQIKRITRSGTFSR